MMKSAMERVTWTPNLRGGLDPDENEGVYFPDTSSCLICLKYPVCPEVWSLFEQSWKGKEERKDGSDELEKDLWTVFVLKNVLQYPEEECSRLYGNTDGSISPSGWFSVCTSCAVLALRAYQVRQKILKLEKEMEVLREEGRKRLEGSFGSEDSSGLEEQTLSISSLVRRYFQEHAGNSEHLKVESERSTRQKRRLVSKQTKPAKKTSLVPFRTKFQNPEPSSVPSKSLMDVHPLFLKSDRDDNGEKPFADAETSNSNSLMEVEDNSEDETEIPVDINELMQNDEAQFLELPSMVPQRGKRRRHSINRSGPQRKKKVLAAIQCKMCKRSYFGNREFNRHMKHHQQFAATTCDICNYPAKSESKLDYHRRRDHRIGLVKWNKRRKNENPDKEADESLDLDDSWVGLNLLENLKTENETNESECEAVDIYC